MNVKGIEDGRRDQYTRIKEHTEDIVKKYGGIPTDKDREHLLDYQEYAIPNRPASQWIKHRNYDTGIPILASLVCLLALAVASFLFFFEIPGATLWFGLWAIVLGGFSIWMLIWSTLIPQVVVDTKWCNRHSQQWQDHVDLNVEHTLDKMLIEIGKLDSIEKIEFKMLVKSRSLRSGELPLFWKKNVVKLIVVWVSPKHQPCTAIEVPVKLWCT